MKIIHHILKMEKKISDIPSKIRVGPPKSRVSRDFGNNAFCLSYSLALVYIDQGSNLGCGERYMLIPNDDLKFLKIEMSSW